jgi:hypothetical protein
MPPTTDLPNDCGVPPDMVDAVAADAAADADLVIGFFRAVGLAPAAGRTAAFPGAFLLDLGAALRLWAWEAAGLNIHRDAGLPAARDAFRQVCLDAVKPAARDPNPPLHRAVVRLAADRLAWTGRRDLGATIALGDPDGDDLVDALARMLWANRHPEMRDPRRIDP